MTHPPGGAFALIYAMLPDEKRNGFLFLVAPGLLSVSLAGVACMTFAEFGCGFLSRLDRRLNFWEY